LRQKFNSTHKVAAQFPFVTSDTAVKVSDTDELTWDQTNGVFTAITPTAAAFTGFPGTSQFSFPGFKFTRTDGNRDLLSLTFVSADDRRLDSASTTLLTIATRSQNSDNKWDGDSSFVFGSDTATSIMSAATIELEIYSHLDSVRIVPLDGAGNPTSNTITPARINGGYWYSARIDQATHGSTWFVVERRGQVLSVDRLAESSGISLSIAANPAVENAILDFDLTQTGDAEISIVTDLGQVVSRIELQSAYAGKHRERISLHELPAGHYTVILRANNQHVQKHLVVLK
jgi:hypothetical protein